MRVGSPAIDPRAELIANSSCISGIDSTTASQILKRLKQEEFIIEQTARKNSRSKTVKKTVKKPVFIVNK